ncbi:hypothetical protein FACS1894151_00740 [Spirochaetia bacterium]|nr:hypothetical protein FACS1894151_00740 [Spirochaetia bacterium]
MADKIETGPLGIDEKSERKAIELQEKYNGLLGGPLFEPIDAVDWAKGESICPLCGWQLRAEDDKCPVCGRKAGDFMGSVE